jgi:hypothetical protein
MGTSKKQGDKNGIVSGRQWVWHDYTVSQYEQDGITVRVLESSKVQLASAQLKGIFKEITEANKWMPRPEFRVKTCLITLLRGPSGMRHYKGKPIIVLDNEDVSPESVAHEMRHAIFDYYQHYKESGDHTEAAVRIAALFFQLRATKPLKRQLRNRTFSEADNKIIPKERNDTAGIWIFDPVEWSSVEYSEHPNDNIDELFASARAAYVTSPKGLGKAIERFSRLDPKVLQPANELLALIAALKSGRVVEKPLDTKLASYAEAQEEVDSIERVDFGLLLGIARGPLLQMLADPEHSDADEILPIKSPKKKIPVSPAGAPDPNTEQPTAPDLGNRDGRRGPINRDALSRLRPLRRQFHGWNAGEAVNPEVESPSPEEVARILSRISRPAQRTALPSGPHPNSASGLSGVFPDGRSRLGKHDRFLPNQAGRDKTRLGITPLHKKRPNPFHAQPKRVWPPKNDGNIHHPTKAGSQTPWRPIDGGKRNFGTRVGRELVGHPSRPDTHLRFTGWSKSGPPVVPPEARARSFPPGWVNSGGAGTTGGHFIFDTNVRGEVVGIYDRGLGD